MGGEVGRKDGFSGVEIVLGIQPNGSEHLALTFKHRRLDVTACKLPKTEMAASTTYKTVSKFDWKAAATNPEHFSTLAAKGPAFIVYDSAFEDVIGSEPTLTLVETRGDKFAHEAGVYIQKTDSNYFTSNYQSGKSVEIYSVDSKDHKVVQHLFPDVRNGNGGCWYRDQILFCGQGDLTSPSALVLVDPSTSSSETLINNFHGRPFNSLNDVVVHHANDELWFTGKTSPHLQINASSNPSQSLTNHPRPNLRLRTSLPPLPPTPQPNLPLQALNRPNLVRRRRLLAVQRPLLQPGLQETVRDRHGRRPSARHARQRQQLLSQPSPAELDLRVRCYQRWHATLGAEVVRVL